MTNLAQRILMVLVCGIPLAAFAAGGDEKTLREWPRDPVIEELQTFTTKNDWQGAAAFLKQAVAKNPQNADYQNLYAFSMRKGPSPDMDLVFKHYGEALRIDPKHRGAHEYIGEAYLMVGDLAKAKEHLAVLDRICAFGCEEYTDLKRAVADYEAKRK